LGPDFLETRLSTCIQFLGNWEHSSACLWVCGPSERKNWMKKSQKVPCRSGSAKWFWPNIFFTKDPEWLTLLLRKRYSRA
jgi:hypothetical protein